MYFRGILTGCQEARGVGVGVQCPDLSCLDLDIHPTSISSRVTQITTDLLTLSSQLAQVWLPHPRLICLVSFPRLTLRSVTSFRPAASVHDKPCDLFLRSPFQPSLSASFPSPSISLALAFPLHGTILLPC